MKKLGKFLWKHKAAIAGDLFLAFVILATYRFGYIEGIKDANAFRKSANHKIKTCMMTITKGKLAMEEM